jgi:hypothetical protein
MHSKESAWDCTHRIQYAGQLCVITFMCWIISWDFSIKSSCWLHCDIAVICLLGFWLDKPWWAQQFQDFLWEKKDIVCLSVACRLSRPRTGTGNWQMITSGFWPEGSTLLSSTASKYRRQAKMSLSLSLSSFSCQHRLECLIRRLCVLQIGWECPIFGISLSFQLNEKNREGLCVFLEKITLVEDDVIPVVSTEAWSIFCQWAEVRWFSVIAIFHEELLWWNFVTGWHLWDNICV